VPGTRGPRGRGARRLASLLLAAAATTTTTAATAAAGSCVGLLAAKIESGTISATAEVTTSAALKGGVDPGLPARALPFCRVNATLTPTPDSRIQVEVWLPPEARWNGKFQGVGNGGLAGEIPFEALASGLARGYATAATDGGHDNRDGVGAFALGHPEKIIDYGHRAIHLTAAAGRAIASAYYHRAPQHAYFVGCSQGGQEALMEAQRYPADYDGIVAGDPDYNQTHHEVGAHLWVLSSLYGRPEGVIDMAAARLIGGAVNRACDALDGVADGILEDPRRCHFDPGVLQCRDAAASACLSAAQVEAVRRLWAGPDQWAGQGYYPGLERGGEAALWDGWIIAGSPEQNVHGSLGLPFFRYFVYGNPQWDFRSFDYRADPGRIDARFAAALDAIDPDLGPFQARGGKLIHYHGFSDPDIPPRASIDYYESVVRAAQARRANVAVGDYYRLFMVPGMGHCGEGPGPNVFDPLAALQRWVEQGSAPARIIATKYADDDPQHAVLRTRPLCPYPQRARYQGLGSSDEAANFSCE